MEIITWYPKNMSKLLWKCFVVGEVGHTVLETGGCVEDTTVYNDGTKIIFERRKCEPDLSDKVVGSQPMTPPTGKIFSIPTKDKDDDTKP